MNQEVQKRLAESLTADSTDSLAAQRRAESGY